MTNNLSTSKKPRRNRLHPAIAETYIALGADAFGMTASDYQLRNRLKNRLSRIRDRETLEKIAAILSVSLD